MADKELREDNGWVHLMSGNNAEYTVCGDAFDIGSEPGLEDLKPTDKKVVTCPKCIAEIKNCRGVKTRKAKEANHG